MRVSSWSRAQSQAGSQHGLLSAVQGTVVLSPWASLLGTSLQRVTGNCPHAGTWEGAGGYPQAHKHGWQLIHCSSMTPEWPSPGYPGTVLQSRAVGPAPTTAGITGILPGACSRAGLLAPRGALGTLSCIHCKRGEAIP